MVAKQRSLDAATAPPSGADRWGAQFECIGRAGHINVESGHGPGLKALRYERLQAHETNHLATLRRLTLGIHAHGQRGERMLARQWFG